MKIYIGADHNGFALKNSLAAYLRHNGFDVVDKGGEKLEPGDDYPLAAARVATAMMAGGDKEARGILICGSGQGVCIAANRFKGIRASVCSDAREVRAGRNDDDTNVLCLPARIIKTGEAEKLVMLWLKTPFAGATRYKRRIKELDTLG